jgi:putative membrane protein
LRLLVTWVLNALTLLGIAYLANRTGLLPGFGVAGLGVSGASVAALETAAVAVAILAILNLTVRPILKLLALPITCLTFGLFTLVINALMMLLTSRLVVGFTVGTFFNAVVVSVVYAAVSAILNAIFNPKEDD